MKISDGRQKEVMGRWRGAMGDEKKWWKDEEELMGDENEWWETKRMVGGKQKRKRDNRKWKVIIEKMGDERMK